MHEAICRNAPPSLAASVPRFAGRVLHVGCGRGQLGAALKHVRQAEVYGLEPVAPLAQEAEHKLDAVAQLPFDTDELPFPEAGLDCIILDRVPRRAEALKTLVSRLAPLLTPTGYLLVYVRVLSSWRVRARLDIPPELTCPEVEAALAECGFQTLSRRPVVDEDMAGIAFKQPGKYEVDGHNVHVNTAAEIPQLALTGYLLMCTSTTYNIIGHADQLFDSGRPEAAHEILSIVMEHCGDRPGTAAQLAVRLQLCLLAWDVKTPPMPPATGEGATPAKRLERFWEAQNHFYLATEHFPKSPEPYQCQAQFWRRLGDEDMAARLVRTAAYASPEADVQAFPTAMHAAARPAEEPPEWREGGWPRKVLMVTRQGPQYGLDVLYDGLCQLLGSDAVDEFPWKPSLHGEAPDSFRSYPCTFDWPGAPLGSDEVLERLAAGYYDAVLYGDVLMGLPAALARGIASAAGDTPLAFLDTEDDPCNNRPALLAHLAIEGNRPYFKREMLSACDYGPEAWPMPFAYPDSRVPERVHYERAEPVFWAGDRRFGLRQLYVSAVSERLGQDFGRRYEQDEYAKALTRSRIGLNCFGLGFDTVRYWELAAHGCMLLSERLPIAVPHNFRDGESAVFFDDLGALLNKLDHYVNHPGEVQAIAEAGRERLKRYHTSSARARMLLGWLSAACTKG